MRMGITVTLNLTNDQLSYLLSIIVKDDIAKKILIGELSKHSLEKVEDWNASVRLNNIFRANGIVFAEDLTRLTESEFIKFIGVGYKAFLEVSQIMHSKGLRFKDKETL